MIRVEKIPPEQPTYNILGLSYEEAQNLRAVLGQVAMGVGLNSMFQALPAGKHAHWDYHNCSLKLDD